MRRVFADTAYWIALLDRLDDLHERAVAVSQTLAGTEIVTSHPVLTEFLNFFANAGPVMRSMAQAFVGKLLASSRVYLLPMSAELFGRTLEHYGKYQDKAWSFVDGSSMLIMQDLGITDALTHDHHFEQAGFKALLR